MKYKIKYPRRYKGRELDDFSFNYQNNNKKMNNGIGQLSWINVKSALMFSLLTAVAGVLVYILGIGDIFSLDIKVLINIFVLSLGNGILSVIKSLLTTNSGNFIGVKTVEKLST